MRLKSWTLITGTAAQLLAGCAPEAEPQAAKSDIDVASAALAQGDDDDGAWRMAAFDPSGSGHNTAEKKLTRNSVSKLQVKWTFDAAAAGEPVAPIHAVPVVADGETYVGSYAGRFYAIDADGQLAWKFDTYQPGPLFTLFFGSHAPIVAAAVLPKHSSSVVFGDTDGRVYSLERATGALLWTADLDDHDLGGIWGNSLMVEGDTIYVGIASFEPLAPFFPERTCCSHRGAVVALDVATGAVKWRWEAISSDDQDYFSEEMVAALGDFESFGPSGGDIWSQPTFDKQTNTLYVGTGQLFSRAPDGTGPDTHDAIVALDAATGQPKWVTHLSDNVDVFRFDIPYHTPGSDQYYDKDVADQPKVYRTRHGQNVVAAGQKDGRFHVLDALTGAVVSSTQHIDMITGEGGFQSGGAVGDEAVFAHGVTTAASGGVDYDGIVMALEKDGTHSKWEITLPGSPLFGSLAVANEVLFFQSPFDEGVASAEAPQTWGLYAVDAASGAVLKRIAFPNGRSLNGPAIADGRLYAAFGNSFAFGLASPSAEGGVVCLGLPGDP
jgi:polyvinyl alcohol dehydrogenase (cytochrome)